MSAAYVDSVPTCCSALSCHFAGGTEKNREKPVTAVFMAEILTGSLKDVKQMCLFILHHCINGRGCRALDERLNDLFVWMYEEMVMVYFRVLFQHLP